MSTAVLELNTSLGALEIGVIVSAFLFGVLTLQVYCYYSHFPADSVSAKTQVAFVWYCELANTVCLTYGLYLLSVSNYGDPEYLAKRSIPIGVAVVFAALIPPIVQTYFAVRIYRLSHKMYILALSAILSFLSCLTNLANAAEIIKITAYEELVKVVKWLLPTYVIIRLLNDVLLAAILVVYLYRERDGMHAGTLRILDKLIKWTVETGLIIAIASVAQVVCFFTMERNYIWIGIWSLVSRLYANCYLASLNGRVTLRAIKDSDILIIDSRLEHLSSIVRPQTNGQHTSIQMELMRSVTNKDDQIEQSGVE